MPVIDEIREAIEALNSPNADTAELTLSFGAIAAQLSVPEQLQRAFVKGLPELLNKAICNASFSVRRAALHLVTDTLLSFRNEEIAANHYGVIQNLLNFVIRNVLHVPSRTDLYSEAFQALAKWCEYGYPHREAFLVLFPIEQLRRFNICEYCPSDIQTSYINLVAAVLRRRRSRLPLFSEVVRIFLSTINGAGNTCAITSTICEALSDTLYYFLEEKSGESLLEVRFIESLVSHVSTSTTHERACLQSVMRLLVKCLVHCEQGRQKIIDQGLFAVIDNCLRENNPQALELACLALEYILACSPFQIGYVLEHKLISPLLLLRLNVNKDVRRAARRALWNFTEKARPTQLFTALTQTNVLPRIAQLLTSDRPGAKCNGMHFISEVLEAQARYCPENIPTVLQLLDLTNIEQLCEQLRHDKDRRVRDMADMLSGLISRTRDPDH